LSSVSWDSPAEDVTRRDTPCPRSKSLSVDAIAARIGDETIPIVGEQFLSAGK
jgi:hypothetical protein